MAGRPLRICVTIYSSPWSKLAGGGQLAVHEHATALHEAGHEVHALYSHWRHEPVTPRARYAVHLTHQFDCPRVNLDFISFGLALARLARRFRFDVIHNNAEEGFFAGRVADAHGAVTVSTLHAARLPAEPFARRLRRDPSGALRDVDYHLLRATLGRAHHIIALGNHSRDTVLGALGEAWRQRVTIIPPGIQDSWFAGSHRAADGFRLVTWSRLVARKGIEDLLEAVARLAPEMPELTLTVFGEGDAAQQYRELAARLGVADRTRFAGFAPPEEIQAFALGCHAAVFPSHVENSPRSAVEAAALGLPVVATFAGSTAERLKDGESALLIRPGDIDALCEAIRVMMGDRGRAAGMGESARRAVSGLRWSTNAAHTVELYRSLLGRRGN